MPLNPTEAQERINLIYNVRTLAQMKGINWFQSIMRPHGKDMTLPLLPTVVLRAIMEQWGHQLPGFRRR